MSRAQEQRLREDQGGQGCARGWCLWECGRVGAGECLSLGGSAAPCTPVEVCLSPAPVRCRDHELNLSEPVCSPEMACPLVLTLMAQWWQAWHPEPTVEHGWAPPVLGALARPLRAFPDCWWGEGKLGPVLTQLGDHGICAHLSSLSAVRLHTCKIK